MYYKLFRRSEIGLTSLLAYGQAQVIYREDEENRPPRWLEELGYGILAFRTLEEAKEFVGMMLHKPNEDEMECWEVEGEEIAIENLPVGDGYCYTAYLAIGVLYPDCMRTWPPGTVMLKTCKLIRRVELG